MTKSISNHKKLNLSAKISPDISTQQSNEVNQSTTKTMAQSTGLQPSGGLQIVHVTTGRVRFCTTDSSLNSILDSIAQDLRSLDGVREVSVNEQTGSLIINFDEDKLSLPQILAKNSNFDIQPQAKSDSASNLDPFAAWKSLSFWKEQGISLIPMMTGLAVTRGLAISGWVSIPVYMIAADATRNVIGYLGQVSTLSEKNKNYHPSSAIKSDIKKAEGRTNNNIKQFLPPALKEGHSKDESELSIQEEKSTNVDKASEVIAPAKIDYSVVHAINGRIRLNVPKIAVDRAYGRRLERLVKSDAQVTSVRVNFDAASIAIAYHPNEIPLSHWVSLIELALETKPPTYQQAEISQTSEITDLKVSQSAEVTNSTTELSSPWTNLKSPAMSFSLGIMANLPLEM